MQNNNGKDESPTRFIILKGNTKRKVIRKDLED